MVQERRLLVFMRGELSTSAQSNGFHDVFGDRLTSASHTEDELLDCVETRLGLIGRAQGEFFLDELRRQAALSYCLVDESGVIATLENYPGDSPLAMVLQGGDVRLSRFAYIRPKDGTWVVESALGVGAVRLESQTAFTATQHLNEWIEFKSTFNLHNGLLSERPGILELLAVIGALDFSQHAPPEHIDTWEFHDLLFHVSSRRGRSNLAAGAIYKLPFPRQPPLKTLLYTDDVSLGEPTALPDIDFFTVLRSRHSRRKPGPEPITIKQLGAFLYWSATVKNQIPDSGRPGDYAKTFRIYPGAGACYELELYVVINRCEGITEGCYHYRPDVHRLGRLPADLRALESVIRAARTAYGGKELPDILIIVASRFGRIAWKYGAISYALTLKNVGVLYQNMYLVAEALGLGGCALGSGNITDFSRLVTQDFLQEGSVGEFVLNSRGCADDDCRAHAKDLLPRHPSGVCTGRNAKPD